MDADEPVEISKWSASFLVEMRERLDRAASYVRTDRPAIDVVAGHAGRGWEIKQIS